MRNVNSAVCSGTRVFIVMFNITQTLVCHEAHLGVVVVIIACA